MGTTLQHGIFLPAEGERNCYTGLASNWTILDGVVGGYSSHAANLTIHVTAEDKTKWDAVTGKADASALTAHTGDTTIHVTAADKEAWNGKADASALTAHTGDTTIHVTAEDKEAWNGKADASALTAHTGDTTIHVTAADKQTWDTVTTKANDADVLHLTGDESSTGKKVFGDMATFDGSYLGNEASANARTGLVLESNRDTHGQSGIYITKFRQNKAQGSMSGNDAVYIAFDVLENSVRTNQALRASFTQFVNDIPTRVIFYSDVNGDRFLGTAANKWTHINGLNPSVLSLPNLSAGVDISGYITLGTYHQDTYTPPSDGYISIMIYGTSANGLFVYSGSFGTGMRSIGGHPTYGQVSVVYLPVRAGTTYTIENTGATNIGWAYFYPCMGNV